MSSRQESLLPKQINEMAVEIEEGIKTKKMSRTDKFYADIEKCRSREIEEMTKCFVLDTFKQKRKDFVHH